MYDFRARSDDSKIFFDELSVTKQEFKASCDINNILKKYTKNGVNPFVITQDAKYGDFSSIPSFQEAAAYVEAASDAFMDLPAKVRTRFNNDPGYLLNFLADPANVDEAKNLGLIEKTVQDLSSLPIKNSPPEADSNGVRQDAGPV